MYAKKGFDHHKLWDTVEICYISFTDEIIVEFVHHCNLKNVEPHVESFWNFWAMLVNLTFVFLQEMAFVYLQAMILFRRGIQINHYDYLKILSEANSLIVNII